MDFRSLAGADRREVILKPEAAPEASTSATADSGESAFAKTTKAGPIESGGKPFWEKVFAMARASEALAATTPAECCAETGVETTHDFSRSGPDDKRALAEDAWTWERKFSMAMQAPDSEMEGASSISKASGAA